MHLLHKVHLKIDIYHSPIPKSIRTTPHHRRHDFSINLTAMATSSSKRPASPQLIANPCIKRKNLQWTLHAPSSSGNEHGSEGCLEVDAVATAQNSDADANPPGPEPRPTAAAVESGAIALDDHLAHFSDHLAKVAVGPAIGDDIPRLSIRDYASLYTAHAGSPNGAHFVIHQHDHPIAGTHYDLRLQINETSSVSWAIMYGLPGDPNSVKLNRNATETRIHSLWVSCPSSRSPAYGLASNVTNKIKESLD